MPDGPVSGFTTDAAPTADDAVYIINDPAGTPGSRKAILSDLFASSPFIDGVFDQVDTDGTLAADSDAVIPSQKAVKTYVDSAAPSGAVLVTSTTVQPGGNFWDFVLDEDTLTSNSDTKLPTQQSVKAYVDTNAVTTGSTSTAGWAFVLDEDDMASNSATKLPTQQSTKAYVDNLSTLTTSDTGKVPITTTGGVTIIDVDDLLTSTDSDFADGGFTISNTGDPTKIAAFSSSNIPTATTNTYAFPDIVGASDVLVTEAGLQTLTGKKYDGPTLEVISLLGVTVRTYFQTDAKEVNDATRAADLESFGYSGHTARHGFLTHGGGGGTPSQTASGVSVGEIVARGYTNSNAWASADGRARFVTTEAPTTSANGLRFDVVVVPTGTTTVTRAFTITGDTVPQAVSRGPVVVNAGSSMASARTGCAFDQATEGGFAFNPATTLTYASPTSVDTTKGPYFVVTTVNATGSVTFNASSTGVSGQMMFIKIINDATSGKTITFGTNFKSTGTLVGTTSNFRTIAFMSDGTNWCEQYRVAAIA